MAASRGHRPPAALRVSVVACTRHACDLDARLMRAESACWGVHTHTSWVTAAPVVRFRLTGRLVRSPQNNGRDPSEWGRFDGAAALRFSGNEIGRAHV